MARTATLPAAKVDAIQKWFQRSGVAHSIKDLEKALPSVASINGMQVKDYLQALQDDNKIRVEKIGSGNWYWNFPSEEKKSKEAVLAKAREERDKAVSAVNDLKEKVDGATAEREEDEGMLMGEGESRHDLTERHATLVKEVEALKKELASYSENDPTEVERKKAQTALMRAEAEKWTEQILSVEGWVKENVGGDRDQMICLKRQWYGDDFDEEEDGLKEL